jgi:putative DNA primase/helicase
MSATTERTAPSPFDLDAAPLTEAGTAERFAGVAGDDWRYDHQRQCWWQWTGHYWRRDLDGALTRAVLAFSRRWQHMLIDAAGATRDDALTLARALERHDRQRTLLLIARDLFPFADRGDGWDADPWLLGTPTGVVDLRTGRLRDGRREDRITLVTAVPYDPTASSALWNRALSEIQPDVIVRDYLHIGLGYSTTGDTTHDAWFLTQGPGRNGKGTVLGPVFRALGDYALELPASAIALDRGRPYELAQLPGKRFVLSSEAGDTVTLHHDRLKQLTGGDHLTADAKYQHAVTFRPVCKLWLAANRTPRVNDDSPAFWARVRFVPFTQSFVGREDVGLRRALETDPQHQAAILAWLVAGAVRYGADGLTTPETIRAATNAYEVASDPLADWIAEAMTLDPSACLGATDAYTSYGAWATRAGLSAHERLPRKTFGERLAANFPRKHTNRGQVYDGLRRRDE